VKVQQETGIVGNGDNDTMGDFSDKREADFFGKAVATFKGQGTDAKAGLKPEDIYTNEFIDTSIGF
jgi:hypothetical protein